MINSASEKTVPVKKSKHTLLLALLAALLLVSNAVWAYVYAQQKNDHDAATGHHSHTEQKSSNDTPIQSAKKFREIPEYGLKYELTPQTEKLTYAFVKTKDSTVLGFSTIALTEKITPGLDDQCDSYNSASGSLSLVDGTAMIGDAQVKDRVDGIIIKKVGDKYLKIASPQAVCAADKNLESMQSEGRRILGEAFKTMTTIE